MNASTGGAAAGRRPPSTSPTLTGARVVLRALRPADAATIVDLSFYDGVPASNADDARAMLERVAADQARGETVHWGICLAGGDEVVGTIGFYRGFDGGVGEVGYVLRASQRGRGLMGDALAAVVAYAFGTLGLRAVVATTDAGNAPSIALLRRLGFEGAPLRAGRLGFVRYPPARDGRDDPAGA
jgi:[ribosomal protein S5]-alanine N-acetyltransferase